MASLFLFVGKVIQDRLFRRFALKDYPEITDPVIFQKIVTPITNLDDLLLDNKIETQAVDLTAAAGTPVLCFTVPKGKRWRIYTMVRDTCTGTTRMWYRKAADPRINLEVTVAAAGVVYSPGQPIILDETWTIGLMTTGNGADTTRAITVHYGEEDSFS